MRQQYVGKNITELRQTIDSVQSRVDSTGQIIAADLRQLSVVGTPTRTYVYDKKGRHSVLTKEVPMNKPIDLNAKLGELTATARFQVVDKALAKALSARQECEFRGYMINDDLMVIRRHQIEMQKKFTLSLACLIFFFIGAPLGAIIRKGGLGTPIVISVLLFIVYYVIDTMGYKLARDGHWWVWQGIWLSSAVLLPLGLFLTHKAVNDSAVFNPDAYLNFFRRITGMHQVRKLEVKEVIINEVEPAEAIEKLQALKQNCEQFLERYNNLLDSRLRQETAGRAPDSGGKRGGIYGQFTREAGDKQDNGFPHYKATAQLQAHRKQGAWIRAGGTATAESATLYGGDKASEEFEKRDKNHGTSV